MAFPYTRIETATPASPIKSAITNSMQDGFVGKKHGSITRTFSPIPLHAGSWATVAGSMYLLSGAGGIVAIIPLPVDAGCLIEACSYKGYGDGVVDVTATLRRQLPSMAGITDLGSVVDNNRAAAYGDVVLAMTGTAADRTIDDYNSLFLQLSASAANARCGNIKLTYSRP